MNNIIQAVIPRHPFATVGCDPEFFLKVDDKFISAIDVFPGGKYDPRPLMDALDKTTKVGEVIHDNVAVEFTMPPAYTREQFANNIVLIRSALLEQARQKLGTNTNVTLDSGGSAVFPTKQLAHPDALQFGCDPDFDAWNGGKERLPPDIGKVKRLRSVGGHVHIGFMKNTSERVEAFLKDDYGKVVFTQLMDMSVGQFIADWERNSTKSMIGRFIRRRTMYGAAGSFRPKEYGVEYRSPSPIWCTSRFHAETVYDTVQTVCAMIDRTKNPYKLPEQLLEQLQVTKEQVIASVNRAQPVPKLLNFFRWAQKE